VDKIVGPGNVFVTTAKRLLFGKVDIDMIAGPSEVVVLTDGTGNPIHLAADLLAQAEHDEHAVSVLISTSRAFAESVLEELETLMPQGPWQKIASISIRKNGKVFIVETLDEAIELVNRIAPEHLELSVQDPEACAKEIRNAGAIFLGSCSAETLGDYIAGPNHVLPTMGTARFFSPLGVYDFIKRSSILKISPVGLARLGPCAARMATLEGLPAHAKAIQVRLKDEGLV
jgi:histidinol dehydrogenase